MDEEIGSASKYPKCNPKADRQLGNVVAGACQGVLIPCEGAQAAYSNDKHLTQLPIRKYWKCSQCGREVF